MKRSALAAVALVFLALTVSVPAFAYPPFTAVKNVCPTCKQEPADVVTLTSGEKIRGQVVGENPSFYVVVRYTEARAIPRSDVKSIEWANKTQPPGVANQDQILLKNGVVFNGTITEDKEKPALYQIKSSYTDQTYVVFKSLVQEAYKSGTKLDVVVPTDDNSSN